LTGLDMVDSTPNPPVFVDPHRNCRFKNVPLTLPLSSGTTNELSVTCIKTKDHRITVTVHVDAGNVDKVEVPESPQAGPGIAERVQMLESASAQLSGQFRTGAIVAFSGTMADAEAQTKFGWWVCDARVVNDPTSSAYNGQKTPDLSAKFLLGSKQAGTIAGNATLKITDQTIKSHTTGGFGDPRIHGDPFTHMQGAHTWTDDASIYSEGNWKGFEASILPPSYSVIYLIKVR